MVGETERATFIGHTHTQTHIHTHTGRERDRERLYEERV